MKLVQRKQVILVFNNLFVTQSRVRTILPISLAKHRETSLQLQFTNMAQFNLIATQLEDAIRESEEEAETRLKMTLPDDPDYFDLFRAYDEANNVEHELTLDQHLDPYAPGISIEDRVKRERTRRTLMQESRWTKENVTSSR